MTDQEKRILDYFLSTLQAIADKDPFLKVITDVLQRLKSKGELHVKLIIKDDGINAYYWSFMDEMVLNVPITALKTRFFGLITSEYELNDVYVNKLKSTSAHELQHYIANNRYESFRKIWAPIHKKFYLAMCDEFLKSEYLITKPEYEQYKQISNLLKNTSFLKALDIYFKSVTVSDFFRVGDSKMEFAKYILKKMYEEKIDALWVRFFDYLFNGSLKLSYSVIDTHSLSVYRSLKNAYMRLFAGIENSIYFKKIFFYQETFYASEISCVLAGTVGDFNNSEIHTAVMNSLKTLL